MRHQIIGSMLPLLLTRTLSASVAGPRLRALLTMIFPAALCFVSFFATLGAAFADECADDDALKKHVILLEAKGGAGSPRHASGVLVHSSGLVLTTFALIKDIELKDNQKLGLMGLMDDQTLENIEIRLIAPVALNQKARILGVDVRRSLLLLKISILSQDDVDLEPVPVSSRSMKGELALCFVGYEKDEKAPTINSVHSSKSTTGVHWRTNDLEVDTSALGGAVIRQETGELGGLISNTNGGGTDFLPIEYTDTLLSQLFIARIVSYMEPLQWKLDWNLEVQMNEDQTVLIIEAKHYMGGGPKVDFIKLAIQCVGTPAVPQAEMKRSVCGTFEPQCVLEAPVEQLDRSVFVLDLSDGFQEIAPVFKNLNKGLKYEKVTLEFTVTPLLKSEVKHQKDGCWVQDQIIRDNRKVENKFEKPIEIVKELQDFSIITRHLD